MKPITNVEDLRVLAKKRLPKPVFEYIDTGAYDEITFRRNIQDFRDIQLRQRVLVGVADRSSKTTLLGDSAALPAAISSVGLTGLLCPGGMGEIYAAKAAHAAGIPFAMSIMSVASMEEIQAAIHAPFWFQIYFFRDLGALQSILDRATESGCSALLVTVCAQVPGQRHSDIKNGLSLPPRIRLDNFFEFAARPRWAISSLVQRQARLGNLAGIAKTDDLGTLLHWAADQLNPALTWRDIRWLRDRWPKKLVVKGVLDPEDAKHAADSGADAIVVSNHGGTHLDGAPSSISVLPRIVEAVGDRMEILLDSGVRSGHDILKALALGAHGCLLGRAHMYALGAMGQEGVSQMIELIAREFDVSMGQTGARSVSEISRNVLWDPPAGPNGSAPPRSIPIATPWAATRAPLAD